MPIRDLKRNFKRVNVLVKKTIKEIKESIVLNLNCFNVFLIPDPLDKRN